MSANINPNPNPTSNPNPTGGTPPSSPPPAPKKEGVVRSILHYFDFREEKENEYATIEYYKNDIDFRGSKAWIMICAIFIASIGLNMNSIPVIIGAMLISPLMGPIIGIGLGLGITDFDLVRKSTRNLCIATVIGIIVSTIYFRLSPISMARSELLARTQPTAYDVLIALFGGVAGIMAGATKSKGNVIPGVAIATALMPPLCTVGYGIATMQSPYIFGAFYLYMINCIFICLATFIMIKILKYPHKVFVDEKRERKLNLLVSVVVTCAAIPSIIIGYTVIEKAYFTQQEEAFISKEFNFPNTQVIRHSIEHVNDSNVINVALIGEVLSPSIIQSLQEKIPLYGMKKTTLIVKQGFGGYDLNAINENIREGVNKSSGDLIRYQQYVIDSLRTLIEKQRYVAQIADGMSDDIKTLFPEVSNVEIFKTYISESDTTDAPPSLYVALTVPKLERFPAASRERLEKWIKEKLPNSTIRIDRSSFAITPKNQKNEPLEK